MPKAVRLTLKLTFAFALLWTAALSTAQAATCTPGQIRYINTFSCCGQGTEYAKMTCNSTGTGWYQTGWQCFPTPCF
jgi:hypothetical protein